MKAVKEGHAVKKTAALKTTQFAVSSANVSQCRFELRQPFGCSKTLRQFFELFYSEARQVGGVQGVCMAGKFQPIYEVLGLQRWQKLLSSFLHTTPRLRAH